MSAASTPHFQIQQTSGNKWRWYSDGTDSCIRNATGGWNVAKFTANARDAYFLPEGIAYESDKNFELIDYKNLSCFHIHLVTIHR